MRRTSLVIPWGLQQQVASYEPMTTTGVPQHVLVLASSESEATPQVSTLQVDVEKAKFQQRAVEIAEQLLCCQGQSIYGRLAARGACHGPATIAETSNGWIGCPLSVKGTHKKMIRYCIRIRSCMWENVD